MLGVDRINPILTQAPVEESPRRNILDFKLISIKKTSNCYLSRICGQKVSSLQF